MSKRVGLELSPERIRAVTVSGLRSSPLETFEVRWSPAVPGDAVAVLKQHLGEASSISVGVGLGLTHVKRIQLPPVSEEERRGMVTLEPDRFFAIDGGEIVAATRRDSDLVFVADAAMVESCIAELEQWAPVVSVESSAVSLARVLSFSRSDSGAYPLEAIGGEAGILELSGASLKNVRRIAASELAGDIRKLPEIRKVPPEFLVAFGAALGRDAPVGEMLVSSATGRRIRNRRRGAIARSVINVVLALAFVGVALDHSRSKLLKKEEVEVAALTPRAASASVLQERMAKLDVQSAVAGRASSSANPVEVLAAISRLLPRDATVMSVRADGDDWQVDGTARDAGRILPALDADARIDRVRFLAGTSRFTQGGKTYETFSLAFHATR